MDNNNSKNREGTIGRYFKEKNENAKNYIGGYYNDISDAISNSIKTTYDNSINAINYQIQHGKQHARNSFQRALHKIYFYEAINWRQDFLEYSPLSYRVLGVFFTNWPLIYFSKGITKIRNPIVFTFVASILIAPEIINPFNRSL